MYKFLVEKYIFTIFACERFKVKLKKNVNSTKNTLNLGQNTSKYRSQIIVHVVYVHANDSKGHPECHNIISQAFTSEHCCLVIT